MYVKLRRTVEFVVAFVLIQNPKVFNNFITETLAIEASWFRRS